MSTYYPQDAADVVLFVTVALCCIIGFAAYVAGIYDTLYPLPAEEDEQPALPRYPVDAEANRLELNEFAAKRDLMRGTSDNLVQP